MKAPLGVFFLALLRIAEASPADWAIRGQMRKAVVLRRVLVSEDLDLLVAVSNVRVGLFLQHRREDGCIYRLVEEHTGNCEIDVEVATSEAVVLSCTGNKGLWHPNRKFLIDIRAKAVAKAFRSAPWRVERVLADGVQRAVFVATEAGTGARIAIEYTPPDVLRVLPTAAATQWIARAKPSVIRLPPIPQSTYDEFRRARPRRVSNGYTSAKAVIAESPGPTQMEGTRAWEDSVLMTRPRAALRCLSCRRWQTGRLRQFSSNRRQSGSDWRGARSGARLAADCCGTIAPRNRYEGGSIRAAPWPDWRGSDVSCWLPPAAA